MSQVDSSLSSGTGTYSSTYSQSGPGGTNQDPTILGTYTVDFTTGAVAITSNGNPLYTAYLVSGAKVDLVTSGSGSDPLALVESTSAAPLPALGFLV